MLQAHTCTIQVPVRFESTAVLLPEYSTWYMYLVQGTRYHTWYLVLVIALFSTNDSTWYLVQVLAKPWIVNTLATWYVCPSGNAIKAKRYSVILGTIFRIF
jgi:hypothetical protein